VKWEPEWIDTALKIVRTVFNGVYLSRDSADNQEEAAVDKVKESQVCQDTSLCILCSHLLARNPTIYSIICQC
jgi:hypothetical protein